MFRNEGGQSSQPLNFNHCLKVTTELLQDQSPTAELPLTIRLTTTNIASSDPIYAEICFDEVEIKVGVPSQWHSEKFNNLTPGQSWTFDFKCHYNDLPYLQYEIAGKVSYEAFFRAKSNAKIIPRAPQTLSVLAYLQVLNDINIHKWLEKDIYVCPLPEPSLSLADLKSRLETLSTAIQDIDNIQKYLNNFASYIKFEDRDREKYDSLRRQLEAYFKETIQSLSNIHRILEKPNSSEFRDFAKVRNNTVNHLAALGTNVNKAVEEYLQLKNISDSGAHYIYRGWQLQK